MATVATMLGVNARHHGSCTAVTSANSDLNWVEIADRSARLATALLARGIQPGDRMALVSGNCPEILETYYAAALSGVIAAPAGTQSHPAELEKYFHNYLKPRVALLGPGTEGAVGSWLDDCDIIISLPGGPAGEPYAQFINEPAQALPTVNPEDPYTIGQTSGTTGQPKGVIITQRNAVSAIFSFIAENPIDTDDAYLIQHPMSNVPGGPGQLFALPKAARTVLLSHFDAADCLAAIQRHQITHTVMVPTMLYDVLAHPDLERYDTSSLKCVITGAAPIPRALLEEAVATFGEVFRPMYGMTESTSVASVLRPADCYPVAAQPEKRLLSAGTPSAGVELRVVNDDGTSVAWDDVEFGEILLRGANIATSYWGDVEENHTTWEEDWLRTGDMATVDEDGFIYIVDRKKDVIISGGTNVASREVEEVLASHPSVSQAAVVGVPDERWGEAVTGVVVPTKSTSVVSADELLEHCRTRLGGAKVPKSIRFLDELPTSPMGKVLKVELRRLLSEGK